MNFETIADVYEANDRIRERLLKTVAGLTEEQAGLLSEKGDWTVAGIVEHLTKVENGMTRISAKLLNGAREKGQASDGSARLSAGFIEKIGGITETKFNAPEVVQPGGEQTIAESIEILRSNRERLNGLREMFETVDGTKETFPHPAFGNMTAQDWLALIGGHETRHTDQIERILGK